MVTELVALNDERLRALDSIKAQKDRIERCYNQKVKSHYFAVGDLVWKTILPLCKKYYALGK